MNETLDRPKFIINPALVPTQWIGDTWGFLGYTNRSYANSVWLGTVVNFLNLPQHAFECVVVPALCLSPGLMLLGLLRLCVMPLAWLVLGLAGMLVMMPFERGVLAHAEVLDEDQAEVAAKKEGAQAIIQVE